MWLANISLVTLRSGINLKGFSFWEIHFDLWGLSIYDIDDDDNDGDDNDDDDDNDATDDDDDSDDNDIDDDDDKDGNDDADVDDNVDDDGDVMTSWWRQLRCQWRWWCVHTYIPSIWNSLVWIPQGQRFSWLLSAILNVKLLVELLLEGVPETPAW